MKDVRMNKLAKTLIKYSVSLKKGEKVLIETFDIPPEFVNELIKETVAAGGIPLVDLKSNVVLRELYKNTTEKGMKLVGNYELYRMKKVDAYIGARGSFNISEMSDVPMEKMKLYQTHWFKPVHLDQRVPHTKWVVLRWPTSSMAQQAGMSTEAFENFYFDVCTMNYDKMSKAMNSLKAVMEKTDKVRVKGPGTDLRFSIKGIPVIKCDGKLNIPDGEIFTAPVMNSVNGVITYNTPTIYQGTTFENIKLKFKNGKIIEATASDTAKLNKILDSDKGARYIGEFAIGVNPYITRAMKDILFDEKIMGSFHFTPGNSYGEAFNGNKSEIHWDMVCIQTKEFGGGEIYFDDVLVRKDGVFVGKKLESLNPKNLK